MNKIVKFFHELRNPHCPHCAAEREVKLELERESRVCQTCEALKLELAKAHELNRDLLRNITAKPEAEKPIDTTELKPIVPTRHLTFGMRRQMMEAEDRRKAQTLREQQEAAKTVVPDETKIPTPSASTEVDSNLTAELEAELDVVAKERESQSGQRTGTE